MVHRIAKANRVIFTVEPERWIVAHSGITKFATGLETPASSAQRVVTGIVAALELVPRAVAYAGSILPSITNGFLCLATPAAVNCNTSMIAVSTNARTTIGSIFMMMSNTSFFAVMFSKIAKM